MWALGAELRRGRGNIQTGRVEEKVRFWILAVRENCNQEEPISTGATVAMSRIACVVCLKWVRVRPKLSGWDEDVEKQRQSCGPGHRRDPLSPEGRGQLDLQPTRRPVSSEPLTTPSCVTRRE